MVSGQNKGEGAGYAGLHDVEGEIVDAGVVGGGTDIGNDQGHKELLHGLFQGIKFVDGLGGFCVTADSITGFCRVQNKTVVFQGGGGQLNNAGLRILWMYFKSHVLNLHKKA